MKFKTPVPVADAIIEKGNKIVLVLRGIEPFKRMIVIPGGHVDLGETVEQTAIREAFEETGLKVKLKEILGVYSDPKRDPRKRTIGTVFIAEPLSGALKGDTDALEAKWFSLKEVGKLIKEKKLGFDHAKILSDYLKWKKKKGTYWSSKR